MSEDSSSGCGCPSLILGVLMCWAWWFGLPTPWGTFHIDIFPPAIDLVEAAE